MLVFFNIHVSKDRKHRIEVFRLLKRESHILRTLHVLPQCLASKPRLIFYDDDRKDYVCLLDGATYEQIVSNDI